MKAESKELTLKDPAEFELSTAAVIAQVRKIQDVMRAAMHEGEHYGVIPGTPKPTLLKPGAEKLCLTFRLDPQYESLENWQGDHLTIKSKCVLWHQITGMRMGSGEGSCSTKESKYAYRESRRKCPKCGKESIIKGKAEYGGGWLCFAKQGGCGAKYRDGDQAIEGQATGKIANENLADQYNTVLKMANKRALVAATLNVTAASDIFTQDIEEMAAPPAPAAQAKAAAPAEAPPSPPPENGTEQAQDDGNVVKFCPTHNVAWVTDAKGNKRHANPSCSLGAVLFGFFVGYAKQAEESTEKYLTANGLREWGKATEEQWLAACDFMQNKAADKLDVDKIPY